MKTILVIVVGTAALTVCQIAAALVTAPLFGAGTMPAPPPNAFPWQLGSNLVTAAMTVWLARSVRLAGARLWALLAAVVFGIMNFNSLIEALFFGFFGVRFTLAALAMTALSIAGFVAAVVAFFRVPAQEPIEPPGWSSRITPLRFAAGSALYLALYFIAGLSIMPFIEDFYLPRGVPPFRYVVAMQLLVRGPIFVALCALVIRVSRLSRPATILLVGATMSVLGGVAPLMVPNAFFPDPVRWAHFVEVTTSNFLFGAAVAALLTRSAARHQAPVPAPAV